MGKSSEQAMDWEVMPRSRADHGSKQRAKAIQQEKKEYKRSVAVKTDRNMFMDRFLQGVSVFVILGLGYREILRYVNTSDLRLNLVLGALPMLLLLYLLLAPQLRK